MKNKCRYFYVVYKTTNTNWNIWITREKWDFFSMKIISEIIKKDKAYIIGEVIVTYIFEFNNKKDYDDARSE